MLSATEYNEFIDAITAPVTLEVLNKYSLSEAKRKLRTEAQEYADRVLTYFEKKRGETNE